MSRLMSVAMTTDAVIERRKTVTRRKGWWLDKSGRRLLHVGDTLTLCRKVQGRKPGEPIERLAEVEVVDVRRELLGAICPQHYDSTEYGLREVAREGFPGMSPVSFVDRFFADAQGIFCPDEVTRIEWRYLDPEPACDGCGTTPAAPTCPHAVLCRTCGPTLNACWECERDMRAERSEG